MVIMPSAVCSPVSPSSPKQASGRPSAVSTGSRRCAEATAIAIANPSIGSGGVNLVLTNTVGGFVADATIQLGPREQFSRFLNEIFPLQVGVSTPLLLTVSAELPVAILALNFQGEDFAQIPLTSLSFPTPVPAQPLVLAPSPALPRFAAPGATTEQVARRPTDGYRTCGPDISDTLALHRPPSPEPKYGTVP